jgi:hypothetical protein
VKDFLILVRTIVVLVMIAVGMLYGCWASGLLSSIGNLGNMNWAGLEREILNERIEACIAQEFFSREECVQIESERMFGGRYWR